MFSLVVLEIILANTRTQPIKFICTNNEDKDLEFLVLNNNKWVSTNLEGILRYLSTTQLWSILLKTFPVCALEKIVTAVSMDLCCKKQKTAHLCHIYN